MGNFKEDIARIEAFVFDVDGVYTDGDIVPMAGGDFLRKYNAKDGFATTYALKSGYRIGIITAGWGETLEYRFRLYEVTRFHCNCTDKLSILRAFMDDFSLEPEQVLYMGDDLPDLACMKHVGMPVCPADAATEIIEASRYVSQFPGGGGCVRDVIEQVLRARGDWGRLSVQGGMLSGPR